MLLRFKVRGIVKYFQSDNGNGEDSKTPENRPDDQTNNKPVLKRIIEDLSRCVYTIINVKSLLTSVFKDPTYYKCIIDYIFMILIRIYSVQCTVYTLANTLYCT